MAIPDSDSGWGLQDVITEINASQNIGLVQAFTEATGAFDPAYVGNKDRLLNFRNYSHFVPGPCRDVTVLAETDINNWEGTSERLGGLNWSSDGMKAAFCREEGGFRVHTMQSPFNIFGHTSIYYDNFETSCNNRGVWVSRNGSHYAGLFDCQDGNGIRAWNFVTPWDPNGAASRPGAASGDFPLATAIIVQDENSAGKTPGSRFWIGEWNSGDIVQYDMNFVYDYSSANRTETARILTATIEVGDIAWSEDGTHLYVLRQTNTLDDYLCPNPFDITGMTLVASGAVDGAPTLLRGLDIQPGQPGKFNMLERDKDQTCITYEAFCTEPAANLAEGCIGYWSLGEPNGATVALNELTGTEDGANHLIIAGQPGVAGIGTSYNFDGNGEVNVPSSLLLETLGDIGQDYAVSLWVKSNLINGSSRAIEYRPNNSGNYPISFQMGGTAPHDMLASTSTGTAQFVTIPGATIWDDNWHNVIMSLDAAGELNTTYLDGVLLGTSPHYDGCDRFGGSMQIGNNDTATAGYKGNMQQVAIWDRQITGLEAAEIWNGGAGKDWAAWNL